MWNLPIQMKIWAFSNIGIAMIFNSIIIEIYGDIIPISHGFDDCQTSRFIAVIKGGNARANRCPASFPGILVKPDE